MACSTFVTMAQPMCLLWDGMFPVSPPNALQNSFEPPFPIPAPEPEMRPRLEAIKNKKNVEANLERKLEAELEKPGIGIRTHSYQLNRVLDVL